jgi:hypothetical protein
MAVKAINDCPADLLAKVLAQLNALQTDVAALRTALNQHTHTENLASAYTQNATTGVGPALPALTSQQVVKA